MNAIRRALALALCGMLFAFLPAGAGAQTLTSIVIACPPADDVTPALYANQAGLFRAAGLNVEVRQMANGPAIASAVLGGALQFGLATIGVPINSHAHGVALAIVVGGGIYSSESPDTMLVVRKDSPIKTARDLNGKIVTTTAVNDIAMVSIRAWMDANGGDSRTVRGVEMPFSAMPAALAQGRIDAADLRTPILQQALGSGEVRAIAQPYDALAKTYLQSVWFTTPEYARANPDVVSRFARAMHEASVYANAHHNETGPLTAAFLNLEPGALNGSKRTTFAERTDPRDVQSVIVAMAKYKAIDAPFDAKDLFDPSVLPRR